MDYEYLLEKPKNPIVFKAIKLSLASPDTIRGWSHGEVKKPETINYRTFKPERDGLFCARIFGPTVSYECYCGRYKKMRHWGVICEKCGVEVTHSRVRRERMGHIDLVAPVAHIWFVKSVPSKIGALLDLSIRELERVIYFESYVVIDPANSSLQAGELISEEKYRALHKDFPDLRAGIGAEALKAMLSKINIERLCKGLRADMRGANSEAKRRKAAKRLKVAEAFHYVKGLIKTLQDFLVNAPEDKMAKLKEMSAYLEDWITRKEEATNPEVIQSLDEQVLQELNRFMRAKELDPSEVQQLEMMYKKANRPEWMILEVVPILPPDLRPLVSLDGGQFATSDLNDLYRQVINRNNRLKRLIELQAPDIIVRNEKRMLQEAVDALFDNGRRGRPVTGTNRRPLKSLSDMIKGKTGRFRQNLLGKRVDYSGRAVIVVGPELRLHQCGLPKKMALELFKPFILNQLEKMGHISTIKAGRKMIEREEPEVWDALEEVTREHPVLLNRAPTLHRLSMRAFEPILVEGDSIRLHPLVCSAYNADFDGDQMAVHVPLSIEAQAEARVLLLASNNILSPSNGKPVIAPSQDIVLGLYYLTREKPLVKGHGMAFGSIEEVRLAYDSGVADLHARVKLRIDGRIISTTVGRALLYELFPKEISFDQVNKVVNKRVIADLLDHVYRKSGMKAAVVLADRVKDLGFEIAARAGISISMDNLVIPEKKQKILEKANKEVLEVGKQYAKGLITEGERYNKVVDIWAKATDAVTQELFKELSVEEVEASDGSRQSLQSLNPIYIMLDSGARGSAQQIRQLAGMRGLMAKPSGAIIETPIEANFKEGLSVLQYFISTHGARKGLADTALKTANAGYLTRRLVDVAQDIVVLDDDCGTIDSLEIRSLIKGGEIIERLGERLLGYVTFEDVYDKVSGELVAPKDAEIDEDLASKIEEAGIESVRVRSVLTCKSKFGVCRRCYGRDLAAGRMVEKGTPVGIIAAQSIGEPGTQLTMRTFHIGGTAFVVEESFIECRFDGRVEYRSLQVVEDRNGNVLVMNRNGEIIIKDPNDNERERYHVVYGSRLLVRNGQEVHPNTRLAEWDPYNTPIITNVSGFVRFCDLIEKDTLEERIDKHTGLATKVVIPSKNYEMKPSLIIVDEEGKPTIQLLGSGKEAEVRYFLPVGAMISVEDGAPVVAGDVLARIPTESAKTKDITGGLPRVVELFEGRRPKDTAIISEIDGAVFFEEDSKQQTRGRRKIVLIPDVGDRKEYLIPQGKHIIVHDGDRVKAGEQLTEGSPNPHDLLAVLGELELARYVVDEIQEVYRLQGVRIHDKHIQVIVRQMLKRVLIKDVGDTDFIVGESIEKWTFEEENRRMRREEKGPAVAEPLFLGITRAALITESFVSAASFQETTKVLTEASLQGKIDQLRGLKENVIMGRVIPAGTGLAMEKFHKMDLEIERPPEVLGPGVEGILKVG
ncbi:MAG: DNA-directed RNA polymerase subunit beta' [Nitrospirota bacterium]|nr:DNA-directed RNA polymerase subunit beta' [Nitrospirota bacterium]